MGKQERVDRNSHLQMRPKEILERSTLYSPLVLDRSDVKNRFKKSLINHAGMQHKISVCLGKFKFILQSNTAISLNEQVIILFIGFTWSGIEDYTGVILLKLTNQLSICAFFSRVFKHHAVHGTH